MEKSPPPKKKKRRITWKVRFAFLCFGLMLGLLTAEISLRVLGYGFGASPAYRPDDHVGVRLVPNHQGWQSNEGRAYLRINSQGLRDVEHTFEKPDRTYRIVILGDSYSEAAHVEFEETFWSVMANNLKDCLPPEYDRVEVINFGVSGYGTAQELETLRRWAWDYEPDMVLLAFLAGNDIRNNSVELEPDQQRPFYVLEEGKLELDDSFRSDPAWLRHKESSWIHLKNTLIHNVRLCALIYHLRHYRETADHIESAHAVDAGLTGEIYTPPANEEWERAWDVTERLVAQMNQEVSAKEIPFLVMAITIGVEVLPDDKLRKQLCAELKVNDLSYPYDRLESLGEREGFPVVVLSDRLREYAVENQEYLHGFTNTRLGYGHWNAVGHRLAGEITAEYICEHQLMQSTLKAE